MNAEKGGRKTGLVVIKGENRETEKKIENKIKTRIKTEGGGGGGGRNNEGGRNKKTEDKEG